MGEDESYPSETLLSLVKPELESLVGYWLAIIRDASVIFAGSKGADQIPQSACAFFKVESFEVRVTFSGYLFSIGCARLLPKQLATDPSSYFFMAKE